MDVSLDLVQLQVEQLPQEIEAILDRVLPCSLFLFSFFIFIFSLFLQTHKLPQGRIPTCMPALGASREVLT